MIYYIYNYTEDAVKIGYAKSERNVWLRCENLQVGSATPLLMLKYEGGTQAEEIKKHQQFKHLRIRGEWFHLKDELLSYINPDVDIEEIKTTKPNEEEVCNYHAKKYNKNTKKNYVNINYLAEHLNLKNKTRTVATVYDFLKPEDTNETIKQKLKYYDTLHPRLSEKLSTIFVEKEGHHLTVEEVAAYLKQHNILNKAQTNTLPVSKVAYYFNTEVVVKWVKNRSQRCIVGLDYARQ